MLCRKCLDDLPSDRFPHATTCREYANAYARERGDCLGEAAHIYLVLLRAYCGLAWALRVGSAVIEE
jgi:hypothetical protein